MPARARQIKTLAQLSSLCHNQQSFFAMNWLLKVPGVDMLSCRMFIGQSGGAARRAAAGGAPGMAQKEQKAVLADFRAGAFNTIVATCIGEEGLDIPQVLTRLPRWLTRLSYH